MNVEQVIKNFGVDPEQIGSRNRGWFIIETPDEIEFSIGVEKGYLCVKTRDCEFVDEINVPNFIGTVRDSFDQTYVYYYFKPLG